MNNKKIFWTHSFNRFWYFQNFEKSYLLFEDVYKGLFIYYVIQVGGRGGGGGGCGSISMPHYDRGGGITNYEI